MKTVMSGPLLTDDQEAMIGSGFVVKAGGLAEVEAFSRNDTFHKAGLWQTVSIRPFLKHGDNRT